MLTGKAEAEWKGKFIEGACRLRLGSGGFEGPYSSVGRLRGNEKQLIANTGF